MRRVRPLPVLAVPGAGAIVNQALSAAPVDKRQAQTPVKLPPIKAVDLLHGHGVPPSIVTGFNNWLGDRQPTKRKAREYLQRFGLTGIHPGTKCVTGASN